MNYFFSVLLGGFILLGIDWSLVGEYLVEVPSVLRGILASF